MSKETIQITLNPVTNHLNPNNFQWFVKSGEFVCFNSWFDWIQIWANIWNSRLEIKKKVTWLGSVITLFSVLVQISASNCQCHFKCKLAKYEMKITLQVRMCRRRGANPQRTETQTQQEIHFLIYFDTLCSVCCLRCWWFIFRAPASVILSSSLNDCQLSAAVFWWS